MNKIAIIGHGRMGKLIEQVARQRRYDVVALIDSSQELTQESVAKADVCIDFTNKDAVLPNVGNYCKWQKNFVIGTTGWDAHFDSVKALVEESNVGAIYAANFSIGMQVFSLLVKEAARLCNKIEGYDVGGIDWHHRHKGDSPSGSAISLTNILLDEINEKKEPIFERMHREPLPEELHFTSLRCGQNPGTHTIYFDSAADTIELTHRARTREGFAIGALLAADWVVGKQGLFTIDDLIDNYLTTKG